MGMQMNLTQSSFSEDDLAEANTALQQLPAGLGLPGAETFFWGAITSHSLAHGYVLKGKNTAALYNLALTIAQIMNCQQRPEWPENFTGRLADLACGVCQQCRWISQNAHPGVLTISRLTYQVDDSREIPELLPTEALEKLASKANWPTQIKTKQVEHLIHQLGISSDAMRVVIFSDAEELPAHFRSNAVAPSEWRSLEATQDRSFHIRPLQRHIFNAASVNRFLKTLEEPPPRTVFFFLVETEEQLLETVVSRCQVVPCLGIETEVAKDALPEVYLSFLGDFIRRLGRREDVYRLAAEFGAFFLEEQGLKMGQALDAIQQYLRQYYRNSSLDEAGFMAYRSAQLALDDALRIIASKTNETQSLLNLFLRLETVLQKLPITN